MKVEGTCYRVTLPVEVFVLRLDNPWDVPDLYQREEWGFGRNDLAVKVFGIKALVFEAEKVPVKIPDLRGDMYRSADDWQTHGYSCLRFGRRRILVPWTNVALVEWVFADVGPAGELGWHAWVEGEPELDCTMLLPQWAEAKLQEKIPEKHVVFRYPLDV